MHKLIQLHGYYVDLSTATDAEIVFVIKVLKLIGQHIFDVINNQVIVACIGKEFDSCFIKKKGANVGTSCKK